MAYTGYDVDPLSAVTLGLIAAVVGAWVCRLGRRRRG